MFSDDKEDYSTVIKRYKDKEDAKKYFIRRKDINGKEICEGDRVSFKVIKMHQPKHIEAYEYFITGTIFYDDDDSCFCIDCDTGYWPIIKFRFVELLEVI